MTEIQPYGAGRVLSAREAAARARAVHDLDEIAARTLAQMSTAAGLFNGARRSYGDDPVLARLIRYYRDN